MKCCCLLLWLLHTRSRALLVASLLMLQLHIAWCRFACLQAAAAANNWQQQHQAAAAEASSSNNNNSSSHDVGNLAMGCLYYILFLLQFVTTQIFQHGRGGRDLFLLLNLTNQTAKFGRRKSALSLFKLSSSSLPLLPKKTKNPLIIWAVYLFRRVGHCMHATLNKKFNFY